MRAFKVTPKALRILAKKLTHLACNSRLEALAAIFLDDVAVEPARLRKISRDYQRLVLLVGRTRQPFDDAFR